MNGRRGFMALFGGMTITGLVQQQASAITPMLILPDSVPAQQPVSAGLRYPLLAACGTETCAMLRIRELTPRDEYREWLESGLRVARLYNGRGEADLSRLIAAGLPHAEVWGNWS